MAMQKYFICAILAFLLTAAAINCEESADSDDSVVRNVVELKEDNFDEAIEKNNHFVMFFAPWCGHCKRLHPLWEELADLIDIKDDSNLVIANVDCTQNHDLCSKHEVTGYPTLKFFKIGEKESVKFKGTRDMPALTEFINQQLNSIVENETESTKEDLPEPPSPKNKLVELTEDTFAKHVSSGNHFVKFYAPWCSHCQRLAPTWEQLSKSLHAEDGVSIAKIDCTVYRPICQDFDVKGYPTLLWIEDGKKIEKYSGARDHDALKSYVEKMLGSDTKQQGPPSVSIDKNVELEKVQVIQLIGDEFQKTVDAGITFVKFYAPWCGHCQKLSPTWDQLAEKMHSINSGVKIAKVDCTTPENKALCVEQVVEGYPTLYAYKNGEKQTEYDGSRSLAELQQYINKIIGHDEL